MHAGNEQGFINGAEAVYCSKTKLSDYHGEMNHDNFLKWFEYQLLYNLEQPSTIVVDNAPYHSMLLDKVPNNSWKKDDIKNWLTNKDIPFTQEMFKTELLHIVSQ